MPTATLSVRVAASAKKRLQKLAKSTGRTSSYLASEAIDAYLDVNEWQIAGIQEAITAMNRGDFIAHEAVRDWVESWDSPKESAKPKP